MNVIADFRSDTVTKPSLSMREVMLHAPVGDDVFGEDPTVKALEEYAAELLGMEEGLFCPSGTMTNQIAIRVHTQPQDELICDKRSHIYNYEGGGVASNSLVSCRLLDGERGKLLPNMIAENINPDDIHFSRTRLLCLENTVNKGGGACYTLQEIAALSHEARKYGLGMHLDGARVFNAIVATKDSPQAYGQYFDTISICLSKGLGAPVGSVLLGSKEYIKKAKRVRKVMGGGMRQAGIIAAGGLFALKNNISRLEVDHQRAQYLASQLQGLSYMKLAFPVETNIIIMELTPPLASDVMVAGIKETGVLVAAFGPRHIRMVTHLDCTDEQIQQAADILRGL